MGNLASDKKMVIARTCCMLYQTVSYCTLGDTKNIDEFDLKLLRSIDVLFRIDHYIIYTYTGLQKLEYS